MLERDAPLRFSTSNRQLGGKLCCLLACLVCEVSVNRQFGIQNEPQAKASGMHPCAMR